MKLWNRRRPRLKLPSRLEHMLANDLWKHPGDTVLLETVPFITDPMEFLPTHDAMLFNSDALMGKDEAENRLFHEYRGTRGISRDLPWIDVELVIYIVVNRRPGDDVGIALDYRPDLQRPRVIGGDWHAGDNLQHRIIAPTFDDFVTLLGMDDESEG